MYRQTIALSLAAALAAVAAYAYSARTVESRSISPHPSASPDIQLGTYVAECKRRPTGDVFAETWTHQVKFDRPFAAFPQVMLSPRGMSIFNRQGKPGTFYQLFATNVTPQGFDILVQGAHADSFSSVAVDWIAVANSSPQRIQFHKGSANPSHQAPSTFE